MLFNKWFHNFYQNYHQKMKKWLKTSTKIGLKFTLFTVIIVLLFGVLANVIFFRMWRRSLNMEIQWDKMVMKERMLPELPEPPQKPNWQDFREKFINRLSITTDSDEYQELQKNEIFKWYGISKLWTAYFYYQNVNDIVIVRDITTSIQAQKNLLFISIYLLVFFGILSYILSIYFVKTSLNKLNDLVEYVKWLNLNNLDKKFEIIGREDDEINILASKINAVTDRINQQTLALKDFISNASHELKTPLMSINSEIDYSLKAKKYKEWMENVKSEIWNINNLLDELVLISKLDSGTELNKTDKDVSQVVISVSNMIEKKYKEKWLKLSMDLDNVEKKVHNSSFEIIAKNLIENAFKYTEKWTIKITLNENEFSVKDSWIWISKENLEKIWDRFWQEDSSKTDTTSFGLGLYLVKLLVEKHWRKISVESEKWKWSEFKILW